MEQGSVSAVLGVCGVLVNSHLHGRSHALLHTEITHTCNRHKITCKGRVIQCCCKAWSPPSCT
jgi:hypothetical protein